MTTVVWAASAIDFAKPHAFEQDAGAFPLHGASAMCGARMKRGHGAAFWGTNKPTSIACQRCLRILRARRKKRRPSR